MMILSKSDYLLFLRHPAWLWLKKHDKKKLPAITDNLQAMFDAGYLFESYAEKMFPDAVRIGFTDYSAYLTQPQRTKKVLGEGVRTVFQGRFESESLTCICDVVVLVEGMTVDLYEIKSSTSAKLIHEHDLAFQMVVLESCGYTVRNIFVLRVNDQYIRQGEIDWRQLVVQEDVTQQVKHRFDDTKAHIKAALQVLNSSVIPDISPSHSGFGALKEWLEIYRSLTHVEKGSIYELCRLTETLLSELESRGIEKIIDIPDDIVLKPQQLAQRQAMRENRVIIDKTAIKQFLSTLVYPLYFLDYETLMSVVPLFDGQKPYQQVPFQYSLHCIRSPGSPVEHVGYLHRDSTNPILPLTTSLMKHIGSTGTILVWYEAFEKARNTEMGCFNDACNAFYASVNDRVVDLMTPFSEGYYVDQAFLGSASIKHVLPILVPELSYTNLGIQEGGSAQRLWMESVIFGKRVDEREKILSNLDEYCTLDTFAMVKIYEKLLQL